MISGLFYYMVTIFNIIFPFHILLERFSHRTFSPSFYRRLWQFLQLSKALSSRFEKILVIVKSEKV